MKVLIVVQGHPEFSRGGAETAAYNLHLGLRRCGAESVFLAQQTALPHRLVNNAIERHDTEGEYFWHTRAPYDDLHAIDNDAAEFRQFVSFVRQLRPEVIHFHHFYRLGSELFGLLRREFPNIRIVMTLHEFLAICGRDGQMLKTSGNLCYKSSRQACTKCLAWSNARYLTRDDYYRRMFSNVDRFVSPSEFLKGRYIEWGLDANVVSVIENAQSTNDTLPASRQRAPEDDLVLGYFGQINPFKGLHVLLTALKSLPKAVRRRVRLNVYGANLELQRQDFQDKIAALLRESGRRVVLRGSYEPEQLSQLFAEIDTLVIPSIWWENSPMVIQESFANRTPVICSGIGGMHEKIRHGVDGLYCAPASPASLAEQIKRLVTEADLLDELRRNIVRPKGLREIGFMHLTSVYNSKIEQLRASDEDCVSLAS